MDDTAERQKSVGLPSSARLYEREYDYWPWGKVISFVASWIEANAPKSARVLDYMCGTGFLLHKVMNSRPDLDCYGCSLIDEYITFAKQAYPEIAFEGCDARKYVPPKPPDIVLCTAGLHHLPYEEQAGFVAKVASELAPGRWFVIGEELVAPSNHEEGRRLAALDLLVEAIKYMIAKRSPPDVLGTATEVLKADLTLQEYKLDRDRLMRMLAPFFVVQSVERLWPAEEKGFGDFVFICCRR